VSLWGSTMMGGGGLGVELAVCCVCVCGGRGGTGVAWLSLEFNGRRRPNRRRWAIFHRLYRPCVVYSPLPCRYIAKPHAMSVRDRDSRLEEREDLASLNDRLETYGK